MPGYPEEKNHPLFSNVELHLISGRIEYRTWHEIGIEIDYGSAHNLLFPEKKHLNGLIKKLEPLLPKTTEPSWQAFILAGTIQSLAKFGDRTRQYRLCNTVLTYKDYTYSPDELPPTDDFLECIRKLSSIYSGTEAYAPIDFSVETWHLSSFKEFSDEEKELFPHLETFARGVLTKPLSSDDSLQELKRAADFMTEVEPSHPDVHSLRGIALLERFAREDEKESLLKLAKEFHENISSDARDDMHQNGFPSITRMIVESLSHVPLAHRRAFVEKIIPDKSHLHTLRLIWHIGPFFSTLKQLDISGAKINDWNYLEKVIPFCRLSILRTKSYKDIFDLLAEDLD